MLRTSALPFLNEKMNLHDQNSGDPAVLLQKSWLRPVVYSLTTKELQANELVAEYLLPRYLSVSNNRIGCTPNGRTTVPELFSAPWCYVMGANFYTFTTSTPTFTFPLTGGEVVSAGALIPSSCLRQGATFEFTAKGNIGTECPPASVLGFRLGLAVAGDPNYGLGGVPFKAGGAPYQFYSWNTKFTLQISSFNSSTGLLQSQLVAETTVIARNTEAVQVVQREFTNANTLLNKDVGLQFTFEAYSETPFPVVWNRHSLQIKEFA